MNNQRFKVIKGGGNSKLNTKPKHLFKKAYATNTRLMGVIGLIAYWETEDNEEYVQLYHLDFEEYGIDGFDSITDGDGEDVAFIRAKMMEGLGGKFKKISKKETCHLIRECYSINLKNRDINPTGFSEYQHLIELDVRLVGEEYDRLWNKICEDLDNDCHLINYFMMRAVAVDTPGKEYLSRGDIAMGYTPTINPSILIKNTITAIDTTDDKTYYDAEALVDYDKGYKLIMSRFEITEDNGKRVITNCKQVNSLNISSLEATFNLKKPEYLILYDIRVELTDFMDEFTELMQGAMQNIHKKGFLFTKFNSNNNHVKNDVYFLNGDIYAVYYVTEGKQLAIGTYNQDNIDEIKRVFSKRPFNGLVEYESEYMSDNQILYEFVHSNYTNFLDFISAD